MEYIGDWRLLAVCRGGDTEAFFVEGAAQHAAKRICCGCPVRDECLSEALDYRIESGVWGGFTESERRALLRRYPYVASWRTMFAYARSAQQKANHRRAQQVPVVGSR
jgi:WhiB family redox-sensing transcriptional regulator